MCGADDRVAFSRNATRKSGGGRQVVQRGQGRWASTVDWVVIVACRSTQEGWQRRADTTQHRLRARLVTLLGEANVIGQGVAGWAAGTVKQGKAERLRRNMKPKVGRQEQV